MLVIGGMGFVSILPQDALVLCCFVSLVIKGSCSYFPFESITESFWGLISKVERAVDNSQETWFLGSALGSLSWALLFSKVNQSKAGSSPRSLFRNRS